MGDLQGHLFIITVCIFFLWVGFAYTLIWCYKKLLWDPYKKSRQESYERARRIADRRG